MLLKYIYMVFLGILLAIFIGVGIAAFYRAPKAPEYPSHLASRTIPQDVSKNPNLAAELDKEQQEFDAQMKAYTTANQLYNRNVSIISLVFAISILLISLTLARNIVVITDGLLLGGVLTLIYSMIRGFGSNDDMFRFLVVAVGLFIALLIGYLKFIKPSNTHR